MTNEDLKNNFDASSKPAETGNKEFRRNGYYSELLNKEDGVIPLLIDGKAKGQVSKTYCCE